MLSSYQRFRRCGLKPIASSECGCETESGLKGLKVSKKGLTRLAGSWVKDTLEVEGSSGGRENKWRHETETENENENEMGSEDTR